jgi:hypothetical protein
MPDTFFLMVIALANMVTEIVKGQPPEVKKQMWEWFVADVKALREFKLPTSPLVTTIVNPK